MGIFFSKPIVHDPTGRICELSKMITTAHSFNNRISEMFEDGDFSMGGVEVRYIASCAVHDHLPVDQHPLLNHYFWKWMSVFICHLPHDMEHLQSMKDSWQKTGWVTKKQNKTKTQAEWYLKMLFIILPGLLVMWVWWKWIAWWVVAPSPDSENVIHSWVPSLDHTRSLSGRLTLVIRCRVFSQLSTMSTSWGSLSGPHNEYFREADIGDTMQGLSLRSAQWVLQGGRHRWYDKGALSQVHALTT